MFFRTALRRGPHPPPLSSPRPSAGTRRVSDHEHDVLAPALNDDFTGRGHNNPVPYFEDLDNPAQRPARGTQPR